MGISLDKIFHNVSLTQLPDKYREACYRAFVDYLSQDEAILIQDQNIAAIKKLLPFIDSNLVVNQISTVFYHLIVYPPKDLEVEQLRLLFFFFLFDSLFQYLPNEISFSINCSLEGDLYLPKLTESICLNYSVKLIRKIDNTVVVNDSQSYTYKINKKNDLFKFSIANISIADLISQLFLRTAAKYDKIKDSGLDEYCAKFHKAVDFLFSHDIDYSNRLKNIEIIIPLAFVTQDITKSFTLSGLPHVIFLSDANSYLKIMENLIHECLHDELNIFMKFYNLIYETGALYYSPWRDDPRPIRGLVHAIYVFTGIFNFYCSVVDKLLPEDKEYVIFRYNAIHEQLKLSFSQLKSHRDELTPLGSEFIDKLYMIFEASKNKYIENKYSNEIIKHINQWELSNRPHKVVLPQDYILEKEYSNV